jgi:hypothetical protein
MGFPSRIRDMKKDGAAVSFIYEPGNGTRFDVVLAKIGNTVHMILDNFNQCMNIPLNNVPMNTGYIASKLTKFRNYGSDLKELKNLIQRIKAGEFFE